MFTLKEHQSKSGTQKLLTPGKKNFLALRTSIFHGPILYKHSTQEDVQKGEKK